MNQFGRNKILAHLPIINEYCETGKTSSPILVEFDLTNVCNHDCPGCTGWRQEGGLNSQITEEDAIRILAQMKSCGVKAVTFTGGGDPTMHKKFDSLIKLASNLGLEVGLITNGLSLKEYHFDNIVPSCHWIRMSWDAATPELHDKVHYNGELGMTMKSDSQFWNIIENTKGLCEYKKKHGLSTTIGCAFLVGSHTKYEIVDFAKLASTSGVDYCQYRPFHYSSYDEEFENFIKEARSSYERDDFKVLFSEFKFNTMKDDGLKRDYNICHGSHFVTHIAANYNVYVCCHLMFTKEACIGNLRESSFEDLWRSDKCKQIISSIDVHKCLPLCRSDAANRVIDVLVNSSDVRHLNFL